MDLNDRYTVNVFEPPTPVPASKASRDKVKGVLKGKILARMKSEAVDCPVLLQAVNCLDCFVCPNFNRRVRGTVGCRGLPLAPAPQPTS